MTNKINGIDVSECSNFKAGICSKRICELSVNENCLFKRFKRLQEELDIKEKMLDKFMIGSGETLEKLQQENEELKTYIQKMDKPEIKTIDSEIALKNIELQEENKELRQVRKNSPDIQEPYVYLYRQIKEQCHKLEEENEELKARLKTLDDEVLTIEITPDEFERYKKCKQALEEIRKEANRLLYEENPIYGYNNSNYFEILVKYVLAKTNEVLEDSEDENNI